MHRLSERLMHWQLILVVQVRHRQTHYTPMYHAYPKFYLALPFDIQRTRDSMHKCESVRSEEWNMLNETRTQYNRPSSTSGLIDAHSSAFQSIIHFKGFITMLFSQFYS